MTKEPKDQGDNPESGAPPSLTIDWDLYGSYLEDSDMSDDQKRELIQTLWSIAVAFVDLGFGIHPVQQAAQESSGQDDDLSTLIQRTVISSKDNSSDNQSIQDVNEARTYSAEGEES